MPRSLPKSKSPDGKVRVAWRLDPRVIAAVKIEAAALQINSAAQVAETILRDALQRRLQLMPKRPEV